MENDKIEFTRDEVEKIGAILGEFPGKSVYWALHLCITKIQELDKGKKDGKSV